VGVERDERREIRGYGIAMPQHVPRLAHAQEHAPGHRGEHEDHEERGEESDGH
jgi:hypothetical protein